MPRRVVKSTWKVKCDCLRKVHFDNRAFAVFFDVNMHKAIEIKTAVRESTKGKTNWSFIKSIVFTSAVVDYFSIDIEECYRNERDELNGKL